MGRNVDFVRKKFEPMKNKCFEQALAHQLAVQFPKIGGPRILNVCAQMIIELVDQHRRPKEHLQHGQVRFNAISIDDPPTRGKTIAQTQLVPVILTLTNQADIDARIARKKLSDIRAEKAIRMCKEAFAQGALLSNCDLAELLCISDSAVASLLTRHERQHGQIVPRRATIHDVGTGLTHKRIIIFMRYLDGKTPNVIARESYHSQNAVDQYLRRYSRVRHCRQLGLTPEQTAFTLNCSARLVREYLAIDEDVERARNRRSPNQAGTNAPPKPEPNEPPAPAPWQNAPEPHRMLSADNQRKGQD